MEQIENRIENNASPTTLCLPHFERWTDTNISVYNANTVQHLFGLHEPRVVGLHGVLVYIKPLRYRPTHARNIQVCICIIGLFFLSFHC